MHLNTTSYDVPVGEEQTARAKMDALGFHSLIPAETQGKISVQYPSDRANDVLVAIAPERAAVAEQKNARRASRRGP